MLFVGTSSAVDTPDPRHRQRVISVVDVEPRAIVQTKAIVAKEAWERAQALYPGRWDVSLRLARAWDIDTLPRAHDMLPRTYAKFTNPGTRGHPIPVEREDYDLLRSMPLSQVELDLTQRADTVLNLNANDPQLRVELSRLAGLIQKDIERANTEKGGSYPNRSGPNLSDVFAALNKAWQQQQGNCGLCGEPIPLGPKNKLLKMSRDRKDSTDKAYSGSNVHLTHYGCNLAKSDAEMSEWTEFREMLRGQRS